MKNKNRYRNYQEDSDKYYGNDRYRRFSDRYNDYNTHNSSNNNYSRGHYSDSYPQSNDYIERNERFSDYGAYSENSPQQRRNFDYSYNSNYNKPYSKDNGYYGNDYRRNSEIHDYRSTGRNWQDENNNPYNDQGDRNWWDKTRDEVSSWFGDDDAERRRKMDDIRDMNHRGKGPKNYKRSSERIKEDVNDRLSDSWMLDASDIEVEVKGSEVTLNGTVDSRNSKRRAEDAAESISGVTHVQNNLRVNANAYSDNKNSNSTINTSNPTYSNGARKKETMSHN